MGRRVERGAAMHPFPTGPPRPLPRPTLPLRGRVNIEREPGAAVRRYNERRFVLVTVVLPNAFVKLVVEHIDGKHYVVMAWEKPNGRKVLAQVEIPQATARLKLEVDNRTVVGYWRLEKLASWKEAAKSDFPGDGEHRFGVFTQDGDPDRPRSALVRDLRWKQRS